MDSLLSRVLAVFSLIRGEARRTALAVVRLGVGLLGSFPISLRFLEEFPVGELDSTSVDGAVAKVLGSFFRILSIGVAAPLF
jgi:hypothetical protein